MYTFNHACDDILLDSSHDEPDITCVEISRDLSKYKKLSMKSLEKEKEILKVKLEKADKLVKKFKRIA